MAYKTDNRSNSYTRFLSACILTITLLCTAAAVCGTAGAFEIWVYVGPDETYTTIQSAVNAYPGGVTIIVRDGVYPENVDVNKSLTIRSDNGSANCFVNAFDSNDHVFDVSDDYVTIQGFTIEGATNWDVAGIYLGCDADHCDISDNRISNNNCGIYLDSSTDNTISDNTCKENGLGGPLTGIHLEDSNDNLILDNNCSENDKGIALVNSANNNLTNNTANSNNNDGIYLESSSHNNLTSNTVNENNNDGIYLESSSNNNLTSNTVNENNNDGINLESSSYNTLTGNTVNENGRIGIRLWSSSNNNVTCNWVQNNSVNGFYLGCGGGYTADNNINRNNIIENGDYDAASGGYDCQFKNDQSRDIDATNNWWGTTDNDTINASIHDWQDDHTKGNVTYLPKLGIRSACAPIPELATIALLAVGLLALLGCARIGRKT